jgi:hypothetical protein
VISVILFLLPTTPVGRIAQPQESARASFPSRQRLGSPFGSGAAQNGISSLAGSRISGRELDLLLTSPTQTKKRKKKSAHAHTYTEANY